MTYLTDHDARKFTLVDDLSDEDLIKHWIVDRWISARESSCTFGPPGVSKSALVEDMGLHVAAGLPWFGRDVRQGAVLYVALERSQLVKRRARAFCIKQGVGSIPFAIVDGVHDFRVSGTATDFVKIADDVEKATGQNVVLIMIDTLSRALCGGDENSSKDMGAIVRATTALVEKTGAHVQWIHHVPVDGSERMRGHSSLLGAVDATFSVKSNGNVRTASSMKFNDSPSGDGEKVSYTLGSVVLASVEGKETTAPVVLPFEGVAPPQGDRLSKSQGIALRALSEVLIDHGTEAPESEYIPSEVKVVGMDVWRQHAYKRGISTSDQPRAKQQAFQRASATLIAYRKVGTYDDMVWLAAAA